MRDAFDGLLYIGALSKRFTWMGHRFKIRTLSTDDVIEVGLLQQPYVGSMGEIKAYQAACVAAALTEVDGQTLPGSISSEVQHDLEPRFDYVRRNYQPIVIDVIYGQLMALEAKVNEVLVAMGKA